MRFIEDSVVAYFLGHPVERRQISPSRLRWVKCIVTAA